MPDFGAGIEGRLRRLTPLSDTKKKRQPSSLDLSMRCSVEPLYYRGTTWRDIRQPSPERFRGYLTVEEEFDAVRRRTMLAARVMHGPILGKRGAVRFGARLAHRPLFDARLVYLGADGFVLCGMDRDGSNPIREYAQAWRVTLEPEPIAHTIPRTYGQGAPWPQKDPGNADLAPAARVDPPSGPKAP